MIKYVSESVIVVSRIFTGERSTLLRRLLTILRKDEDTGSFIQNRISKIYKFNFD